MTIER